MKYVMKYYTYNVKRGRTIFVDRNKPSMIRIKYFISRIKPKIQLPLAKVNINKYWQYTMTIPLIGPHHRR